MQIVQNNMQIAQNNMQIAQNNMQIAQNNMQIIVTNTLFSTGSSVGMAIFLDLQQLYRSRKSWLYQAPS